MRADSLPLQIFGIFMRKIKPPRFRPIETKFVSVAPCGNVRMAACRYIRIHANRNRWNFSATPYIAFRFFEQHFQLCFGLDVEQKNPIPTARFSARATSRRILQRIAYFVARFANSREHNPVAANSEVPQMFEFSTGNNVKTAPHLREMIARWKDSRWISWRNKSCAESFPDRDRTPRKHR